MTAPKPDLAAKRLLDLKFCPCDTVGELLRALERLPKEMRLNPGDGLLPVVSRLNRDPDPVLFLHDPEDYADD